MAEQPQVRATRDGEHAQNNRRSQNSARGDRMNVTPSPFRISHISKEPYSDSQDVRRSPVINRDRSSSHRGGFPPLLNLRGRSQSSGSGYGQRSFSSANTELKYEPPRNYMQSPRGSPRESPRRDPSMSPKYDKPLDKSVIWRVYELAPPEGKLNYINDHLQRHGLHTIPDHRGKRILIDGKTIDRNSGYTQFVGSILCVDDVLGISLLSTMPPIVTVNARTLSTIEKHWDDLELFQAEDGATIGLYWYQNRWIIRTASSFDAGLITWDGHLTFGRMVNDIMAKYPQFRYDALDKTKCYTFGIKHPAIHAYHEGSDCDIIRAWFIQSANIALINEQSGIFNSSVRFDESIGLPLQRPLWSSTFTDMSSVAFSMHTQYVANETSDDVQMHVNGNSRATADDYRKPGLNGTADITLGMILRHTRGALGAVIAAASEHHSYVSECSARGYYGVILRSKKYTFFVPSDLYQYIASTYYTNELNDMLGDQQFNRDKYIVLFNALCPTDERKIFTCIYPQFAQTVAKIREYLSNEFVTAMYAIHDKINNGVPIDNIYSESTLDLARSIYIVWVRQCGTSKSSDRSKMIALFSDYVLGKHNARVLYHDVYASVPFNTH